MYIYIFACTYIYMFIYTYIYIYLYVTNASCRGENKSGVCIFLPLYLSLPLHFSLSSSLSASICISISVSVYVCVFPDRHVQVTHTPPSPPYTHLSIIKVPRFHSCLCPPSSLVVLFSCCCVFAHVSLQFFFTQTHATTC